MKKILLLTMVLCIAVSAFGTAYAEEVAWNDVTPGESDTWTAYKWKVDGNTLYLDYGESPATVQDYAKDTESTRPWASHVNAITDVVITGKPNAIGTYTFSRMGQLRNVTLAGTETAIEANAFVNCQKLGPSFVVPKHVTKLGGTPFTNTGVVSLIFEETDTPIQIYPLSAMGKLKNITLMRPIKNGKLERTSVKDFCGTYNSGTFGMTNPAKINFLVTKAEYFTPFANLTEYTDVTAASGNEMNLLPGKFDKCTVIDKNQTVQFVTDVANSMYHLLYTENGKLTVEFIPNTTVNEANLRNGSAIHTAITTNLASVKSDIKKMVFDAGVNEIGNAFSIIATLNENGTIATPGEQQYPNVEEVVLSPTLTNVGHYAFYNMTNLSKVNFEDTKISTIQQYAFRYAPIKEVILPSTLTAVYGEAFRDNPDLEFVYIPVNNSTTVRARTFGALDGNNNYSGKELKVILDGDAFKMCTTTNSGGAGVSAYAFSCQRSGNFRDVTVIHKSTATVTDRDNAATVINTPAFTQQEASTVVPATVVTDKHYDVYDADNDGKPNLFMYSFAGTDQDYKLFAGVYSGKALSNVQWLADGTAKAGKANLINTEYDVTLTEGETAKVFLWDGFAKLTPLSSALDIE